MNIAEHSQEVPVGTNRMPAQQPFRSPRVTRKDYADFDRGFR